MYDMNQKEFYKSREGLMTEQENERSKDLDLFNTKELVNGKSI